MNLPRKGKFINWKESIGYTIRFIYEDIEGLIKIKDYKNSYLKIEYKNKEVDILISSFQKCKLGNLLNKITSDFKVEKGQVIKDDKRDITITDRKYVQEEKIYRKGRKSIANRKWYKYICNVCGFDCSEHWSLIDKTYKNELWIEESPLSNQVGCACCSSKIVVKNINSIYKTDTWMIPYIGEECAKTHSRSSADKVEMICIDCGKIKKYSISKLYTRHSIGCTCGDGFSYGHKYIFNILIQLEQEFIDNHTFEWCKFYNTYKQKYTTGEYDFMIEQNKLIIEVDGDWHRKDNNMSGQTKEESKFIDYEKDRLAKEYGYQVVRISDEGDIKQNILNSNLAHIFNLNNINWNKCQEYASSNRVKEACEIKRNNYELTTTQIGNIMNMNSNTICKYLKVGNFLGWCKYDAKSEQYYSPIKVLNKQMNLIYMFRSINEVKNQYQKIYGEYLDRRKISEVCIGNRKQYKDLIFKYTTKKEYQVWLKQQEKELHSDNLKQAI